MGHERMSVLPKTKKWRDIFEQIAGRQVSDIEIEDITQKTIQNVRSRFRHIERDSGVLGTFQFLVNLAVASREENPQVWLLNIGIELPNNPTPLSFAKAVNAYIASQKDSFEYSGIAQKAASEAISIWYDQNYVNSPSLLESLKDPFEVWRKAGNGAGFCELSRLFFAKFTQGYLEYFLEREISAALGSIDERIKFGQYLENTLMPFLQMPLKQQRLHSLSQQVGLINMLKKVFLIKKKFKVFYGALLERCVRNCNGRGIKSEKRPSTNCTM